MCGIVGIIHRQPDHAIDVARLVAARDALTHRGPDEAGLWHQPGAGLGHRRLKVLDLTHGQQPMVAADGSAAMVYNGEVYNFRQLRDELLQGRMPTEGTGDTDVLFELLNQRGIDALPHLRGMFAIAHWREASRQLLLVRDRMGQKPLYWYADESRLAFASELKALLILLDRTFDIDPVAVDQFFTRGYIHSPRTIFRDIHKLPAGHRLTLDASSWQHDVVEWYDVRIGEPPRDFDSLLDELDHTLTEAVTMRLVSDAPLGCLLSGGIDSSLITAIAARAAGQRLKAFTIGFGDSQTHDERPYAELVAKHCGCEWHPREATSNNFPAMLAAMGNTFDEPYANFAMFPMASLAQIAREHLTVVLTGQGGDELAAGYPGRYRWATAPPQGDNGAQQRFNDLLAHHAHSTFVQWTQARGAMYTDAFKAAMLSQSDAMDSLVRYWQPRRFDRLNTALYADVKTNLPDYLVCVEERLTMAHALEARNPMLDHRVVELLMATPAAMKTQGDQWKRPLVELARRYVPAAAIDRPKRGFTPPLDRWFTEHAAHVRQRIASQEAALSNVLSSQWLQYVRTQPLTGAALMPTFYTLMFAHWLDHYGKFINAWPCEATRQSCTPSIAVQVMIAQNSRAQLISQWFCKALDNLDASRPVAIIGDDAAWFATLATQSGYHIVDDAPQRLAIGAKAIKALALANPLPDTAVLLLPFDQNDAAKVQAILADISGRMVMGGYQTVPISQVQFLLIARFARSA
jgi:asparagine synthase (glutamine-hydrolysing)